MKFTNFSVDTIVIGEFSKRQITLKTPDDKPIRIQIPKMYMPFGVSGFTPDWGAVKWNIDFSMKGFDDNDENEVKKFYEFLRSIEQKVISNIKDNSVSIFGSRQTMKELENNFNSNIKITPGREPKLRVKVDTVSSSDNNIKPQIYDGVSNIQISEKASSSLFAHKSGTAIIELGNVYFMNKKFGLTWRLYQMKVFEPQQQQHNLKGFQFNEKEGEDEDETKLSGFMFLV